MSRCVVIFGQYGALADPANLPAFNARLQKAGIETILIQHFDSKSAVDFLRNHDGKRGLIGASLGAMSAVIMAGYMQPEMVDFVGGFQPSDYDPSGHTVSIPETDPPDLIIRAVTVPRNVKKALCFRNPIAVATGGLGHATYVLDPDNKTTKLAVVKNGDVHPGDFGSAADQMFQAATAALI